MKLDEIFTSKRDLRWQQHGRFDMAAFDIDGSEYVVQLERTSFPPNIKELYGKNTAIVSFYRNDIPDVEKAHSTTGEQEHSAVATYGVVVNALVDRFLEFDAFYFELDRRHSNSDDQYETKKSIYTFAAQTVARRTGGAHLLERELPGGVAYIVSKIKIVHEGFVDVWMFLREAAKGLKVAS